MFVSIIDLASGFAMAPTRARSRSPVASNKRPKQRANDTDLSRHFDAGLLEHQNVLQLNKSYNGSQPFKYCVLDKLFKDELLRKVKDECVGELSFTEKATDIYRVG